MKWKELNINIGVAKVGVPRVVIFRPAEELPVIKSLNSSCGCSTPVYDLKEKVLRVSFKPNPIPKHLLGKQSFYNTTKYITVTYINGDKDVLSFSSKITQ